MATSTTDQEKTPPPTARTISTNERGNKTSIAPATTAAQTPATGATCAPASEAYSHDCETSLRGCTMITLLHPTCPPYRHSRAGGNLDFGPLHSRLRGNDS